MFSVVAVNRDWAIGKDGNLLYRISDDMKHFKQLTVGKAVIMGRKTLMSLPGSKPLPKRENYILSSNPSFEVEGATVLHSLMEAEEVIRSYPDDGIACIGGAAIYELLLPLTGVVEATVIDDSGAEADTFFPNLEKLGWTGGEGEWKETEGGLRYKFTRFYRPSEE